MRTKTQADRPGYEFEPRNFPRSPGVYLMREASGRVIYVGKAKDLRRRLSSYFRSPAGLPRKTRAMLARVASVDALLASTENEALILEAGLIKRHRPRYNVLLRDDKQYLLFRLDKTEDFPAIRVVRRVSGKGATYFGPFSSAASARAALKLVNRLFGLRVCSDRGFKNRVRPCLYHDLGHCPAPCVLPVDRAAYMSSAREAEMFLKGRTRELLAGLKKDMRRASEALNFERAARLRDLIRDVRATVEAQVAVLARPRDLDVIGLAEAGGGLGLGAVFVRRGRLLDQKSFFWPGLGLDEAAEAVRGFLLQFYGPGRIVPGRIVIPTRLSDPALAGFLAERRAGLRLGPARGAEEKRLLDLACKVARDAIRALRPSGEAMPGLLARALGLAAPAVRVECLDVSHLSGQGLRAGLAVYLDGRRAAGESRTCALPDQEGVNDDYAAVAAWARRRVDSGPPWPDLLVVDGGRGQLAALERALAGAGAPRLELAAIAKGGSRRAGELGDRVFRPGRRNPAPLRPGGPELLFLQRARDSAHDLCLAAQRRARRKTNAKSALLDLPGIGPRTARLLWERFGSVEALARASMDDLCAIPGMGPKRAGTILAALKASAED